MLIKILNIVAALPLIIYPFILLANVMSLAGEKVKGTPVLVSICCYAFLIVSTLYPVTVLYSWKCNGQHKMIIALLPFIHIAIAVIFYYLWIKTE